MKHIIFLFSLILFFTATAQQKYTTENKKAIKLYTEAKTQFLSYKFAEAGQLLKDAIKKDSMFVEAYYLLAGTYNMRKMQDENIACLQTCVRINGETIPFTHYQLAIELLEYGKYEEALDNLKKAAYKKAYLSKSQFEKVEKAIKRSEFAIDLKSKPVDFEPHNLGPSINSEWDDYLPSLTADESFMIVTSRIPAEGAQVINGYSGQEDFFVSEKTDKGWSPRENIGKPINSKINEGAQSMTADGKLFVFTACNRADSYGGCDLYYSEKRGGYWSIPKNMGKPINTRYWESQPSLSADGRVLYFISNKPGGMGGMDIWLSHKDVYGEWTPPKNLGDVINTDMDEASPFIHPDGRTMYLSSKGHPGMGNFDLFVARKNAANEWTRPKNLGYPINTYESQQDLIVSAKGNTAFFSSDRLGGEGNLDIYEFELYKEAQPIQVTYVKGNIFDAITKEKLYALFELFDVETGELIIQSVSDPETGEFLVPLATGGQYALNVNRNGYLFFSEHFSLEELDSVDQGWGMDIPLFPIEEGGRVVLNNVFFDTDSSTLKPESKVELDKLLAFMKQNPTVQIEIGGHTDNTGSRVKNTKLSLDRAKSVYDYLAEKGIDKIRMKYKGYADSMPVAPNDTDENKALNRRTEFMILKK